MSTDGVLGAVWLPTDGWLDPSGLALALAAGARARGVTIRTAHPGRRRSACERGRVTGVTVEHERRALDDRRRRRRQRRRHVRAGDRPHGRRHRPDHPDGAPVPVHASRSRASTPGCRSCAIPDNLVYFREEVGGLCMGGYERDPAPWALDGIPPDFNGKLLAPDWPRFEPIMDGAVRRVPAIADAGVNRMINGPEAFTPDNEFILGECEVRGFCVAAGFCAHGIAGAGGIGRQMASLDRRGRARARPVEDGHPPVRGAVPVAGVHARAHDRGLRDVLRHPLPERGAPGRPAAADVAGLRRPRRARRGRSARSPAGSARTGSSRTPTTRVRRPRASRRSGRAAGPACTGRRRSRPRRSRRGEAAALFDETSFAKLEVAGPGASAFLQRMCAQRHRPTGRVDRLHPAARSAGRDPGRPDRHASGRRPLPARHRDGVRQPRRRVAPVAPARRRRLGRDPRHDVEPRLLRAVGPAGARHPRLRDARRRLGCRLPVPHRARDHASAPCRSWRCG